MKWIPNVGALRFRLEDDKTKNRKKTNKKPKKNQQKTRSFDKLLSTPLKVSDKVYDKMTKMKNNWKQKVKWNEMKRNNDEVITKADRRRIKRQKASEFKSDNRKSIQLIAKQSVRKRK